MASWPASYVPQPAGRVARLRPTGRCSSACSPRWAALMRRAASLETTHVGAVHLLAERRADDAVVGDRRVETVLDQQVLLHAVDLDLHRAGRRAVAHRGGIGERSAGVDPQLLERAQRRARGAADVVDPALQPVELLDDRQRDHHVGPDEAGEHDGSATSTEVSSTIRVRTPPLTSTRRAWVGTRSVNATPIVCSG